MPTFTRMEKDVIPYPVCRRVYETLFKGDNENNWSGNLTELHGATCQSESEGRDFNLKMFSYQA